MYEKADRFYYEENRILFRTKRDKTSTCVTVISISDVYVCDSVW